MKNVGVDMLVNYIKKSFYATFNYENGNKNKFGILTCFEKTKGSYEFLGKIGMKFNIDHGSKLHLIFGTNKLASAKFDIDYNDKLNLSFLASHIFSKSKSHLNGFGAVLTFDF